MTACEDVECHYNVVPSIFIARISFAQLLAICDCILGM